MKNNVTIQDLANALGMSRNTVSKALNGKHVPMKTRNAVINGAIEMGYKGYKLVANSGRTSLISKRIVILSSRLLMNMNYYILVLRGIEEALIDHDIELSQFNITNSGSFTKFKHYLANNKVDGIISIEFFDTTFVSEIVESGIPSVFLDFPVCHIPMNGRFDILLPESRNAVMHFCLHLIQNESCKTFGFVGDYQHCLSFYDRYSGMREALFLTGLPNNPQYSILYNDSKSYSVEMLQDAILALPSLPDCFIAANDTIAINLMKVLKILKIHVPKEIKVIGFDNIMAAKTATPPLTTFNVNKRELGKQIISILLDRIANPSQANFTIYISSKLIIRAST
ncbi:MAG: LacI family DNA-binding transcriptional regulator [Anaerocolumna sp.]